MHLNSGTGVFFVTILKESTVKLNCIIELAMVTNSRKGRVICRKKCSLDPKLFIPFDNQFNKLRWWLVATPACLKMLIS